MLLIALLIDCGSVCDQDIDGLDTAIPRSLMAFVRTVVATAEIVLVIIWATPASGAVLGPLAIFYLLILVGTLTLFTLHVHARKVLIDCKT